MFTVIPPLSLAKMAASIPLSVHGFPILLILILVSSLCSAEQRPFYNIAHMVNSIKEVNYYLARGANALEADVSFSPNGTALYTFHGYPCDCFRHCNEREEIENYLQYMREITTPCEYRYSYPSLSLSLPLD